MGYVHHIFDKYAISPAFQVSNQDKCRNLSFHLLWRTSSSVIDKDLGDSTGELDWRCKSNILHGKTEQQKVSPADSLEWLTAGCGRRTKTNWAPIDTKRIVLKLNLSKEHLSSAILSGCLTGVDVRKELVNLYSQEKVAPDANELIQVDNYNFEISDTSLHLAPQDTQVTYESILQPLREAFQEVVPWEEGKDELWHHPLEKYLGAVLIRREC
ncbi:unnamed protein product [Sphagnum jensenii]|uniref:Uncharacterized protein n=1 Tax=Sphagnum jensenii TaxID=128206 RepID=A0ABP1AJL1_9BRYO